MAQLDLEASVEMLDLLDCLDPMVHLVRWDNVVNLEGLVLLEVQEILVEQV